MTATLASTPIVDEFTGSTQSHNVNLGDLSGTIDPGDLIVMLVFTSETVADAHPQAAGFKRHGYQGDNTGLAYVLSRVCDGSEGSDVVDVSTEVACAAFIFTYHYEAATWSQNQQHGLVINYYAGSTSNADFGVSDTPLWPSDDNVSLLGLIATGGVSGVPSGYTTGLFNSFNTAVATYEEYTGTTKNPGAFTSGSGGWFGVQVIIAPDGADIPPWPWVVNSVDALGTGSTGNLTVPIPAYAQAGDIILLGVENWGNDAAPAAPTGYASVPDSPQASGTTTATDKTRLSVFWKAHSGSESNPTIANTGNHVVATVGIVRGADTSDPFDVTNGGSRGTNSTTQVIVGTTTTVDKTCVVFFFSMGDDEFPLTISGSNLADLQQAFAGVFAGGNTGAVFGGHGLLDAAGATGNVTYTVAASEELAFWLGAVQAGTAVADEATLAGILPGLAGVFVVVSASTIVVTGALPGLAGAFDASAASDATVAGVLLGLSGSFDIAAGSDAQLAGTLPGLNGAFSTDASTDAALTGTLPGLGASFTIAAQTVDAQLAATLPGLTGSFNAGTGTNVILDGTLPNLDGSFLVDSQADATLDGGLPGLGGLFDVEANASATLDGSLPGLTWDIDIVVETIVATLTGTLPGLDGSFSADIQDTAELAGVLPAPTMSMDVNADVNMQLAGVLPEATMAMDLDVGEIVDIVVTVGSLQLGWAVGSIDERWETGDESVGWRVGRLERT